ncbi:MAG: DUF58 domain-containing protein [Granulosicoccaceae bacterium]|jgi:uncharacterized protein (DUF58 family)
MSLSGRSYLIAALIALLGIIGQWSGGPWAELWRYPAAAFVLALAYEAMRLRLRPVPLQRVSEPRALLGRPLQGQWRVENNEPRPLVMRSMAEFAPGMLGERRIVNWRVPADTVTSQPFSITPQQLGTLHWRPVYTHTLGRFGLAWWNRRASLPGTLRVVPDRLHHYEYQGGTRQSGERNKRNRGVGHELLALRDYQPGDPLRAVDWKATARSAKPTVRLYTEEQHLELMLLIDCGRTSQLQAGQLSRLHHYVNVAARLAQKAVQQGDHVGLVTFADAPLHWFAPQRGQQALHGVRKLLEQVRTLPRESNPLAAVLKMRQLVRQRALVVVFTDIDGTGSSEQLLKAVQLMQPKHLPLFAGIVDEEIAALNNSLASEWLDPYHALAARETRHAAAHTVLQLQQLGCQVIEAKARQLDEQVLTCYDRLRERRRV